MTGQPQIPRPNRYARLTGEQRAVFTRYVVTAYTGGQPIRQVATETGTSYGRVHKTLAAAGVPRRPRGWRPVPGAR